MDIEFKKLTELEVDPLLKMIRNFYLHEKINFNKKNITNAVVKVLNNPEHAEIWLIHLNSAVIGYFVLTFFFSLEYGGMNILLDEFFIKEKYRGKGIGKQALKFIEKRSKERGINTIHLQVNKFNPKAKKLYSTFEFNEIDRTFMMKSL